MRIRLTTSTTTNKTYFEKRHSLARVATIVTARGDEETSAAIFPSLPDIDSAPARAFRRRVSRCCGMYPTAANLNNKSCHGAVSLVGQRESRRALTFAAISRGGRRTIAVSHQRPS